MRTAIIGGGAAGLFAACVLGRAGAKAVLLERQARVGRKLLSTGNGRCNLSNLGASPRDYHGEESYVRAALKALSPRGAMDFFEEIGLVCAPDEAGRVYPLSNQAAGVLDALRLCAAECGVETRTEFDARAIRRRGRGFPPGKESSVFRPMITVPSSVRERKRFISAGRENSRLLPRPMAQLRSTTTMAFMGIPP